MSHHLCDVESQRCLGLVSFLANRVDAKANVERLFELIVEGFPLFRCDHI